MPVISHEAEGASSQQVSHRQFFQLFSAVMLPMFLAAADQTMLATATPTVAADFGQLYDTSWLAVGYMLTSAVVIPVYGRLGDRYGRREMLFVAMGLFLLGSVLCAFAPSMPALIAGRAVQGFGGGGLMTLSHALIGELVPPRRRVNFQGYFALVATTANVLGPIIGGAVVAHVSWRWLFIAHLPIVAFAFWRLSMLPRGRVHPDAAGVSDGSGLALFVVGTGMLLFGLSSAGHRFPWVSPWTFLLFGGGALLWLLLIRHERRLAKPFLPLELLAMRTIRLAVTTVVCNTACLMAVLFYLPVYLQFGMKIGAGQSGLLLTPVTAGMIIGGQSAVRLAGRLGHINLMPVYGMSVVAVALFGLAIAPSHWLLVVGLGFLTGLGLGPAVPCGQMIVQITAGPERVGAATALVSFTRTCGATLGTAATGAIIFGLLPDMDVVDLIAAAETAASREVTRVFHIAFGCAALVAVVGALNAWRVPRVKL